MRKTIGASVCLALGVAMGLTIPNVMGVRSASAADQAQPGVGPTLEVGKPYVFASNGGFQAGIVQKAPQGGWVLIETDPSLALNILGSTAWINLSTVTLVSERPAKK